MENYESEQSKAATAKHTPGPWQDAIQRSRSGEHLGVIINSPAGRIGWASLAFVGKTQGEPNDSPENAANARLIAAAPDLLRALTLLHRIALQTPALDNPDDREFIDIAWAAINKAEAL